MATRTMDMKTAAQKAAIAVSTIFMLVGILGFIPGLTTNYEELGNFGEPGAKLLGIFAVNWLHNLVHLGFGLVGLAMARTHQGARNFLIGGGIVYLVLWLYGMIIDDQSPANFVALNTADNWLHFLLGAGMITLGLITGRTDQARGTTTGEGYQSGYRRAS